VRRNSWHKREKRSLAEEGGSASTDVRSEEGKTRSGRSNLKGTVEGRGGKKEARYANEPARKEEGA